MLMSEASSWLLVCVAATERSGEPENGREVPGPAGQLAAVMLPIHSKAIRFDHTHLGCDGPLPAILNLTFSH